MLLEVKLPSTRRVSLSVGLSVCKNILKWREVSLPCSYQRTSHRASKNPEKGVNPKFCKYQGTCELKGKHLYPPIQFFYQSSSEFTEKCPCKSWKPYFTDIFTFRDNILFVFNLLFFFAKLCSSLGFVL